MKAITMNKLVKAFRELNRVKNGRACLQVSNDDMQKIEINYGSNIPNDGYISIGNVRDYVKNAIEQAEETYDRLKDMGRNMK